MLCMTKNELTLPDFILVYDQNQNLQNLEVIFLRTSKAKDYAPTPAGCR